MALETLKRIWKNDYFQMALMVALMAVIVFGFWYGAQLVMNTEYPALAVVSESMLPTLNIGDIIIIQGVNASQIHANYTNGDIVVFKNPKYNDPNFRVVHRAVKKEYRADGWWITTHGDNNNVGAEEQFNEKDLIGKVIAKIPYIGNFSLYVNKLGNFYFFIVLIIVVVGIMFSLFTSDEEKKSAETENGEEKRLFGKLNIGVVFSIILDILLVGFLFFSLFGSFTFYQIGAEPVPKDVTIMGMYTDLQYQLGFKKAWNYVHNASISQGFFTYSIDCYVTDSVHEGLRPGVPTLSWMQVSLLILILYNLWIAIKYFHLYKKLGMMLKPKTGIEKSLETSI